MAGIEFPSQPNKNDHWALFVDMFEKHLYGALGPFYEAGLPPVKTDPSMPVNSFRFEHSDGRMDSFMLSAGEVLPVHLTKLDDPPN